MATIKNTRNSVLISASPRAKVVSTDYISLTYNSNVFRTTSAGTTPATITITANRHGMLMNEAVSWSFSNGTVSGHTISSVPASPTSNNTLAIDLADLTTDSVTVIATITKYGNTYTATQVISKLNDTYILSCNKSSIPLVADEYGTVPSPSGYANATATIKLLQGNIDITSGGGWSFAWSTVSGTATYSGTTTVTITNLATNEAVLRCTASKSGQTSQTIDLTVSKIYAGYSAQYTSLTDDQYNISTNYDGSGNAALTNTSIGTAELYVGSTKKTSGVTFGITGGTSSAGYTSLSQNGLTLRINESSGVYDITSSAGAFNADISNFTLTGTYNSVTTSTIFTVKKLKNGQPNSVYWVDTNTSTIPYNPNNSTYGIATVTVTAKKSEGSTITSSPVGYTLNYSINGGANVHGTNQASPMSITTSGINGGTTNYITVKLYDNTSTLIDSEDIPLVKDGLLGSSGISVELSNDAHTIPTDSAGNNGVYTYSGTEIRVYEGSNLLTYDGIGTSNGTWTVSSAGTSITPGSISDSGAYATVGNHSAMSADTAKVTYTITGKTAGGAAISGMTAVQTLSKAKGGVTGIDATINYLTVTPNTLSKPTTTTFSPTTITAYGYTVIGSAVPTNTAIYRFKFYTSTDNSTYTLRVTSTIDEASKTFNPATYDTATKYIKVELYASGGTTTLLDTEIINTVADGADSTVPGPQGDAGTQTVYAYAAVTTTTLPTFSGLSAYTKTSVTSLPSGTTNTPITTTWDFDTTAGTLYAAANYNTTPPTLSSGQIMVQTTGVWNPNTSTVVWSVPYLSSLRIGKLSALTADMGDLTAGTITLNSAGYIRGGKTNASSTTSGYFLGYDSTAYKFAVGDSTSNLTWDGSSLSIVGKLRTVTSGTQYIAIGTNATYPNRISIGDGTTEYVSLGGISGGVRSRVATSDTGPAFQAFIDGNISLPCFAATGITSTATGSQCLYISHSGGAHTSEIIKNSTSGTGRAMFVTKTFVAGASTTGPAVSITSSTTGTLPTPFYYAVGTEFRHSGDSAIFASTSTAHIAIKASSATGAAADMECGGIQKLKATLGVISFTGAHESLIDSIYSIVAGDILVDDIILYRENISNCVFSVKPSTIVNTNAIGIAAFIPVSLTLLNCPDAMKHEILVDNGILATTWTNNIAYSYSLYYNKVDVNGVGEGQVNVCGINGNINAGDLIVTSSIPGKGMKQSDDIVRNYTVAKARESVTFDYPEQVKQIACIYLCG